TGVMLNSHPVWFPAAGAAAWSPKRARAKAVPRRTLRRVDSVFGYFMFYLLLFLVLSVYSSLKSYVTTNRLGSLAPLRTRGRNRLARAAFSASASKSLPADFFRAASVTRPSESMVTHTSALASPPWSWAHSGYSAITCLRNPGGRSSSTGVGARGGGGGCTKLSA